MTEQMAIIELQHNIDLPFGGSVSDEASEMAIKALEEIQQYRTIGTVEEIKKIISFLSIDNDNCLIDDMELLNQYRALGTVDELKSMKENGAFTGVELAQLAIMQMRLKEYEAIGTLEELKVARNKQD